MIVELPKLELCGTEFCVDLTNEWIYEKNNPANFISFNELEETKVDYRMVYDPQTKNIFKGDEEEMTERIDLKYVIIDQLKWMPAFGFVWNAIELKNSKSIKR